MRRIDAQHSRHFQGETFSKIEILSLIFTAKIQWRPMKISCTSFRISNLSKHLSHSSSTNCDNSSSFKSLSRRHDQMWRSRTAASVAADRGNVYMWTRNTKMWLLALGVSHRIDKKSAWSHYRKSRRHTLLVFSLDPPRCSSFHTPASFFHRYCNAVVEMSVSVHRSRVESSVKGVGRKNTRSPKLNFSPQDDGWRKIEEVEKTLVLKST